MLSNKNCQGFSLIEIIVAFSILATLSIGIISAFPTGLSINKSAENATLASYLAQQKIEEIYSLGYDNVATGTIEVKNRLSTSTTNYLYNFQRETIVTYVDENLQNSATNLGGKKISTTIYYTSPIFKEEKTYNITTVINSL